MKKLILDIKNKLQNFTNQNNDDLFFLIGNFKYLEKCLIPQENESIDNSLKTINDILKNAFNSKELQQENIFEILQELLYIEKLIPHSKKNSSSSTTSNNNDVIKKVAIGLGLGALGFVVGKAFINSNRSRQNFESNEILTIAYYLSMYDHDNLFDNQISATKAIENIAQILDLKPNTLRNKRDYFDAFLLHQGITTKSQRKGYQNAKLSQQYSDIIEHHRGLEEENNLREEIVKILNNYSRN